MCILCVVQKWSRRVATMLPWLVIPLIGLWAFSQLLPPAFRFEITSPRLACVFVLLITLFWYEVLMPQLSTWRARRNARLRERKRFEAIEMQKLRKMAKRRCRNCLTPYRDQNPGAGRFTCTYCGHVSKRPVLDLPVSPGLSNAGILKGLVGKGGKLLNAKVWSDNGWLCGQNGLENGNWPAESFSGKSTNWQRNGDGFFSGDDHCMDEKSYSRVIVFAWKNLMLFFWSIGWVWRKITRVTSSRDDASSAEHNGVLVKAGENGTSYNESRGEKARRKAEEKRQARLERELLEQEERKQREEVARLVEERRKLRDEKIEAEKDHIKSLNAARDREMRKEAERKRQRKEKDKWSMKNNSDVEELEKRTTKESERIREYDRKSNTDRQEHQRTTVENSKNRGPEMSNSIKGVGANNHNQGNAGTRYLDRMRGSFLSSSKAFSGASFFGKGVATPSTVSKENKSSIAVEYNAATNRRESSYPVKSNMNGDAKTINRPVLVETQPPVAPKKSWQQLFACSSAVPPATNPNIISRPNGKSTAETQNPYISGIPSPGQSYDNPVSFGLPSLFTLPTFPYAPTTSSPVPSLTSEAMFPRIGEPHSDFLPDESEIFEDPCYVPDPVSLLGPVSESLDDFQLDLCAGFAIEDKQRAIKNTSRTEMNKPSPIQSPFSRTRVYDETYTTPNQYVSNPKAQDAYISPMKDSNLGNENGTWQMWGTSPLGQDSLGLVAGTRSWLLPQELNGSSKESKVQLMFQKTATSLFTEDNQVFSNAHSPQKIFPGNCQNNGTFATHVTCSSNDHQLQKTLFGPMTGSIGNFCLNPKEETSQCPNSPAVNVPLENSLASCWTKKETGAVQGSGEGIENSSVLTRPHIGGLYSSPDVQSLWSYD